LLEELAAPLIGATLILPGADQPLTDAADIRDALERQIELVIDSGPCSLEPTTVIDLSSDQPALIRQGRGLAQAFGF
jgi:tRNA A37 threonylcarbamoyladenosine synthetase subunit TsaC/SUA5/YrdC